MAYDNFSKLAENVILKLSHLNPEEHLTYEEIGKYFPDESKLNLKRSLENYDFSHLFDTECECRKGG